MSNAGYIKVRRGSDLDVGGRVTRDNSGIEYDSDIDSSAHSTSTMIKKKDSSPDLSVSPKPVNGGASKVPVAKPQIVNSKVPIANVSKEASNRAFWRFVVMCICVVWSTNFAVIKSIFEAVPGLDASLYSAVRFTVAAIVMLPRTFNSWGNCDMIGRTMVMAFFVFLGYFGQGVGMSLGSSADKSAFICSLNCVWVALVQGLLLKVCRMQTWLSVFFAVAGVAMLELNGSMPASAGDLWLIFQPIGFGTGYILLESLISDYPNEAAAITSFKLLFIGIFSMVWAGYNGKTMSDIEPIWRSSTAVVGLLYCSLFTTVAAIWVQSIAFKKVSAKDVSIILCTEPLWATLFSARMYLAHRMLFLKYV